MEHRLKLLMIYPEFLDSFWGFKRSLQFVFKKAVTPPLGLLTVASLLPKTWEVRLIDMNVESLEHSDLLWADLVFVSAIQLQAVSLERVIHLCNQHQTTIVAGGPLFTTDYQKYPNIDHFVLNEAEVTLPQFLRDWHNGSPRRIYSTTEWADMTMSPRPRWDLVDLRDYFLMNIQYSRGCPFNCEFCDITQLYGKRQRTKSTTQILEELELIYASGWRDQVLFVDDNFIGHTTALKRQLLPAMAAWMQSKGHPFTFYTQVSLNLADDEELMHLMTGAGFNAIFVGIESTHEASLQECTKKQNVMRDMVASVHKLQQCGLQVQGGFIVGFDSDPPNIFDDLIEFIQRSGIVTAMVGILQPLRGTRLFARLEREERMHEGFSGNNTDGSVNYIPNMGKEALVAGYRKVVKTIYRPAEYYERIGQFFSEFQSNVPVVAHKDVRTIRILLRVSWVLGVVGEERYHYWKGFLWMLAKRPKELRLYMTLAAFGYHHRKHFERLASEAEGWEVVNTAQ